MSLHCRTDIAPLSLRCSPLSHQYCSTVAPLLLRCCSAPVATQLLLLSPRLLLCCCSAIAQLSLRCRSSAACVATLPLLSLLMSLRCHCCYCSSCHSTVTPTFALVLLWCRSGVAPLSFSYQFAVAPLLLRCRCCHSYRRSCYRSSCHSTAVTWIVHGCRLKRKNLGNRFHW